MPESRSIIGRKKAKRPLGRLGVRLRDALADRGVMKDIARLIAADVERHERALRRRRLKRRIERRADASKR
jgi:hypothetical protein